MSCDVLFLNVPSSSMVISRSCLFDCGLPLMYITHGQVALYRARLDLLSTRTCQYHTLSLAQSPSCSSASYTPSPSFPRLLSPSLLFLPLPLSFITCWCCNYYLAHHRYISHHCLVYDIVLASCDRCQMQMKGANE